VIFIALVHILFLKEKRSGFQSEKQNESEEKRKSAITFVTALFFLVAGTDYPSFHFRWTLLGGLTRKSSDRFAFHLFTFPSAFESKLSALLEMQKASQILTGFS